ncbi:uncharacterized protein N7482_002138 [Penicillium canariense]|uniref:SAP domain-containing protein n=1 Tax=Penicillium canariense TaxID=189055 RepID=A0A9W9IL37_9EURO|nr:uncharacterized protein N7482_002138 [Penicillium canariense]KAJ5176261.1 hypothetical protein N7482_002138 [Penicillium canariense]
MRAPAPHAWLAPLKVAQLQHLARATGIQSSGTKSALLTRIETELRQQVAVSSGEKGDDWSVLSIDMGIQNLAFAHLRVPRGCVASTQTPALSRPVLTAWHRLKVSEIGGLDLEGGGGMNVPGVNVAGSTPESGAECISSTSASTSAFTSTSTSTSTSPTASAKSIATPTSAKETFSPDLYAALAYTLITSLLTAYRPTHILIERQRFRSGGGSAVQEWTLRVGVLEGMLYAVLHALRLERGADLAAVQVHGIEPKRVVRYWGDLDPEAVGDSVDGATAKKGRVSAREVKKAKIDLVGRWLGASVETGASTGEMELVLGAKGDGKIDLAQDRPALRELAAAYLRKWRGEGTRRTRSAGAVNDIGKLDDLADCLLQGVTWVEWQVMRERLAREGGLSRLEML